MLAYSIETALQCEYFSEVYVCTEDLKIAEIAQRYGAKVPFTLPHELCGDLVPSHVPCQEMAAFLKKEGNFVETIVCLQPTSPLRSVEDLNNSLKLFLETKVDFLVSVTPIDPHYFHWAVMPENEKLWKMYFGNEYIKERPLLPPVYRPNGSIKIAHLERLKETGHFFGESLGVVETPEQRSIHVGNKFDFDLCEFILNKASLELT